MSVKVYEVLWRDFTLVPGKHARSAISDPPAILPPEVVTVGYGWQDGERINIQDSFGSAQVFRWRIPLEWVIAQRVIGSSRHLKWRSDQLVYKEPWRDRQWRRCLVWLSLFAAQWRERIRRFDAKRTGKPSVR